MNMVHGNEKEREKERGREERHKKRHILYKERLTTRQKKEMERKTETVITRGRRERERGERERGRRRGELNS